jgi:hypothetical protein
MIVLVPFRQIEHEAILTVHKQGNFFKSVQEISDITGLRVSVIKAVLKKYRESK